ncbi:MAG: transposase [bacterium]
MNTLLDRNYPAHPVPVSRHNTCIILHVTICTHQRKAILTDQKFHACLRGKWTEAKHWRVGNYVIMADHIHMFCIPGITPPQPLASWIGYWKRMVSREFPAARPLWQKDFWDTQMRTLDQYTEKLSYVRMNPVRKELVSAPEDWPFSGELNVFTW